MYSRYDLVFELQLLSRCFFETFPSRANGISETVHRILYKCLVSYGNTLSKSIRKTRVSRFAISVNNSFSRRQYHKFGIILLHRTCDSFTRELDGRRFTVRYRRDLYVCLCLFLIEKERKKNGRLCARSLILTAPFITRRLHDTQTTQQKQYTPTFQFLVLSTQKIAATQNKL